MKLYYVPCPLCVKVTVWMTHTMTMLGSLTLDRQIHKNFEGIGNVSVYCNICHYTKIYFI